MAYDDAFAAAPHVDAARPGLPAVRRLRRGGRHRRARSCSPSPTSTSTRCVDAGVDTLILGCTHYPLLTGVISYVMGDDVTLVSAAPRSAPRTSTSMLVARPASMRDPAGEPAHRFLTTGAPERVREHRPPVPRARARRCVDQFAWVGLRMRLTVVGCSGSYPGPGLAGQLLPRRGADDGRPHLAGAARPRQRRARRAAAVRRPARRSTRSLLSHLHADHCLDLCGYYVLRKYHPTARSRGSRSGGRRAPPTGWRAPTTCRRDPGMNERVRLPRPTTASRSRSARSRSTPIAGRRTRSPAYALRVDAGGAHARLLRRHRAVRGARRGRRRGADLLLAEASFRRGRRQPAGPPPDRRRRRRDRHPRRRRAAGAHPRPAVARPGRRARRGGAALRRPGELVSAGSTYDI